MDKKQLFLTYEIELNAERMPTAIRVSFESPVKAVGRVEGDITKVDRLRFQSDYKLTNFGKVDAFKIPKEVRKLL